MTTISRLREIYPEISKGYVDANHNKKKDKGEEIVVKDKGNEVSAVLETIVNTVTALPDILDVKCIIKNEEPESSEKKGYIEKLDQKVFEMHNEKNVLTDVRELFDVCCDEILSSPRRVNNILFDKGSKLFGNGFCCEGIILEDTTVGELTFKKGTFLSVLFREEGVYVKSGTLAKDGYLMQGSDEYKVKYSAGTFFDTEGIEGGSFLERDHKVNGVLAEDADFRDFHLPAGTIVNDFEGYYLSPNKQITFFDIEIEPGQKITYSYDYNIYDNGFFSYRHGYSIISEREFMIRGVSVKDFLFDDDGLSYAPNSRNLLFATTNGVFKKEMKYYYGLLRIGKNHYSEHGDSETYRPSAIDEAMFKRILTERNGYFTDPEYTYVNQFITEEVVKKYAAYVGDTTYAKIKPMLNEHAVDCAPGTRLYLATDKKTMICEAICAHDQTIFGYTIPKGSIVKIEGNEITSITLSGKTDICGLVFPEGAVLSVTYGDRYEPVLPVITYTFPKDSNLSVLQSRIDRPTKKGEKLVIKNDHVHFVISNWNWPEPVVTIIDGVKFTISNDELVMKNGTLTEVVHGVVVKTSTIMGSRSGSDKVESIKVPEGATVSINDEYTLIDEKDEIPKIIWKKRSHSDVEQDVRGLKGMCIWVSHWIHAMKGDEYIYKLTDEVERLDSQYHALLSRYPDLEALSTDDRKKFYDMLYEISEEASILHTKYFSK